MEVVSLFDVTGMRFTSMTSAKVSRFRFRGFNIDAPQFMLLTGLWSITHMKDSLASWANT